MIRGSHFSLAALIWRRRTTSPRTRTSSSPQIRETQAGKTVSGSCMRPAVAAWRRTTARQRASTSSPQTRETQAGKPISGASMRPAVAACRRTIARRRASTSSPQTRGTRAGRANLGFFYRRPWRPGEGRPRGGAPLQARRRPGKRGGQAGLGFFYETGRGGLAKDDREAARLYKLAADQGNAGGQNNLGVFYARGRGGLAKDDREAARLYKLAADQGDAIRASQSRVLLRDRPWRPGEGRPRGGAPLQARRRPGRRVRPSRS